VAGLAAVTKLTGLATLGVAWSLFAIDAFVNRRIGLHAKGLLFFLPPLLLVAGPFFWMNVEWYGDPTREILIQQIAPAFHLHEPRSIAQTFRILFDDIPRAFAMDLAWQSIHAPWLSPWLFWPWLAAIVASAGLPLWSRGERRRLATEQLVPQLALLWSLILLVVTNRHWTNLQVRHVWCLVPFTLPAIVYSLHLLPAELRAWRRAASWVFVVAMVALNLYAFTWFATLYRPVGYVHMNRDYHTFLYAALQDLERAKHYVLHGR
jgi:hypothetical protein